MAFMEARDPLRWSQQQSALRETDEGQQFLKVLTFWVDAAEKLRSEDPDFPPYDAIQKALVITVEEFGAIRTEVLADMLMVIINFWEYGHDLAETMTPLETAVVHEAVFRAQERLQEEAAVEQ